MRAHSSRPRGSRLAVVLLFAAALGTPEAAAARQGPSQPVKWSLALNPASGRVAAGGRLTAVVKADIGEGWHVYAPDEANVGPRPVDLRIVKNPIFTAAGRFESPEPERELDDAVGQITALYRKKATFRLPVAVAAGAGAGPQTIEIDVSFQACDGSICLPAKTARVSATVTVTK